MTARINTDGQTPVFAAELILAEFFPDLTEADTVLEPSCGYGAFLRAIPNAVPAIGVELDPAKAAVARQVTGRQVIDGDFRTVDIPVKPTKIIGNPPFEFEIVTAFLQRCHDLLAGGGQVGFILPVYTFQTAATVWDFASRWSIEQTLIPRNLFGRLHLPLLFARFTKDRLHRLTGFALYGETVAVNAMPEEYRDLLTTSLRPVWRELVAAALRRLGGSASLAALYQEIEGIRPEGNRFWREKVRQILQTHFHRQGPGIWAMEAAA